jgi:hypothetical protein
MRKPRKSRATTKAKPTTSAMFRAKQRLTKTQRNSQKAQAQPVELTHVAAVAEDTKRKNKFKTLVDSQL